MSRKKQAETWKILYTPLRLRLGVEFLSIQVHLYPYNVAMVIGPPINDYISVAGFNTMAEAKAYRRKKIQEDRAHEAEPDIHRTGHAEGL